MQDPVRKFVSHFFGRVKFGFGETIKVTIKMARCEGSSFFYVLCRCTEIRGQIPSRLVG